MSASFTAKADEFIVKTDNPAAIRAGNVARMDTFFVRSRLDETAAASDRMLSQGANAGEHG
jgi:hypothetical protein